MSLLSSEPPRPVQSLEELFAIAHAMEQEAATRYAEIAERLRREGNPTLGQVFERLAAEERGHLDSVVHWSEAEGGRAPDAALVRWKIPETFDDEGASTTDPRLLSAYRSLSMAVRNEERAFAFWTYVVAHAEHPEVRRAAEVMAGEELDHVATLRRERRRAFHAERAAGAAAQEQPLAEAELEGRLAQACERIAESAGPAEAARLRKFAAEARETARELAQAPMPPSGAGGAGGAPDAAAALAELLVERYLEAAERADDESVLERMQAHARRAIDRLAWLRADLPEIARR